MNFSMSKETLVDLLKLLKDSIIESRSYDRSDPLDIHFIQTVLEKFIYKVELYENNNN